MIRRHRMPSCGAWLGAFALILAALPARASISLPYPFWYFNAAPGATFQTPTGIAFTPDGRLLVSEKRGRVYVVQNGTRLPTPMWQGENEVLNNGDKGLLDVAVDPDFATNGYIYLLYTVDPDTNGVDNNEDAFGRLARYTVSAGNPNVVDTTTRTILMGRVWNEGPTIGSITHSIGSLRWGADKTLLVSAGDGAQFTVMDPGGLDAAMFGAGKADPDEDIGAFRAQDITSLAGKILRLDKATGHGLPSNPFWDGNPASERSKVWCYGLRNPFRFTVRPGSGNANPAVGDPGTIVVGDVGWETWEEISKASTGGVNFGWPCFEGSHNNAPYQAANPAHNGCGSVGSPTNPSPFTAPLADWHHANPGLSSLAGAEGNSALGGVFYDGVSFPVAYRGRLFFADFGYSWIRTATLDANDNVTAWGTFAEEVEFPVDLAVGPYDGDLYYISISAGQVRRIHYYQPQGGNGAPTAVAGASTLNGPAPLTVDFSSAGSSDPDSDSLRTTWVFADGSGSFLPSPTHTFVNPGTYLVTLTVDDNRLNEGSAQLTVTVTAPQPNTPPTAIIAAPADSAFFAAADTVTLSGDAVDAEQPAAALAYAWDVTLHHNTHIHPNTFTSSARVVDFATGDHEDGTGVWYEVHLVVEDAGGLRDTARVDLFPEVNLDVDSLAVSPDPPVEGQWATWAFKLRNHGSMPAPASRWRLVYDGSVLAEGDTTVAHHDSVTVVHALVMPLGSGPRLVRAACDTLAHVVETSETDNGLTRTIDTQASPVGVGIGLPRAFALSQGFPNPAPAAVRFGLDLPRAGRVEFTVLDVQGREVWSGPARTFAAGSWKLEWPGTRRDGSRAPAGLYLARIVVDGHTHSRRIAVVR